MLLSCVGVIFILILVIILFYWRQVKAFRYWKDRGVTFIEPSWFFGNIKNELLKRSTWSAFLDKCYTQFKERGFGGVFYLETPVLVVTDPKLIERILVTDFIHFHDRWSIGRHEVLSKNLVNETGERWRTMRYSLVPAFTSNKVKGMFEQILKSSDYVLAKVDEQVRNREPVEIEHLAMVFVTEAISSCTFGVQLTSERNESKRLKEVVNLLYDSSPARILVLIISLLYPNIFTRLNIETIPKKITEFFLNLTRGAIMHRDLNHITRNDFLQMMLNLKEQEENGPLSRPVEVNEEDKVLNQVKHLLYKQKPRLRENIFTEECIASLMFNFMHAGLKPSVVTISFALLEIARNPEIKNKLHNEIDRALAKHKKWTFEAIRDMPYLDQVIQETLRRHGFNWVLMRKVTEPYRLPGTDLFLEKGTMVVIPILSLHMDPQHFPDPEEFIPERFADHNYKPTSTFLPFGQGPRICIGIKLAVTILKVCIARILSEYEPRVSEKMQLPLVFDPLVYYPKLIGGIWLEFKKRK